MNRYYVYILSNWNHHVIYTGVTNNLTRRYLEHKTKINDGFTKKYHVNQLIYYEETPSIKAAIFREKQIKSWSRQRKNELIESMNPEWKDLALDWED